MGRVEVKVFGQWGYVCHDQFGMNEANVLCRELGYSQGANEVKLNSFYRPNKNMTNGDQTLFNMDDVKCGGNETSLRECNFNGWGVHDCNVEQVVGVVCKVNAMKMKCPANHWLCETSDECIPTSFMCDLTVDCADGSDESPKFCNSSIEYRLADGRELEGRVEVKYRGIWGSVCDDDFGQKEAQVFCNSIGFTGPAVNFGLISQQKKNLNLSSRLYLFTGDSKSNVRSLRWTNLAGSGFVLR